MPDLKPSLKGSEGLSYYIRLMCKEDVAQVAEIDREAFPAPWPQTNYERELENGLAHYVVVCDGEKTIRQVDVDASDSTGIVSRAKSLCSYNRSFDSGSPRADRQYITGFAGFWIMAEEAHITSVAVRKSHRRQGIGELLLISIIDLAAELNARLITLEVRVSNTVSQSLYAKYGFAQVGVRRSYYVDDKEDAVIMSTKNIVSTPFQAHLQQLKRAHSGKWGIALYQIVRHY